MRQSETSFFLSIRVETGTTKIIALISVFEVNNISGVFKIPPCVAILESVCNIENSFS